MHIAEPLHFFQRRKDERDGDHSCLWLLMWSPRSRWPGEPVLTQKTLYTCCWNEGIPGWEPPLLKENYCSQTNINQSHSCAECPTVSLRKELKEKGPSVFERNSTVEQTCRRSLWHSLGAMFVAFKGLMKDLALPSGFFMRLLEMTDNSMFRV